MELQLNILYKIPQQLFAQDIISNYLSIYDLLLLDTSICNKKIRKEYYLNILKYVIFDSVNIINDYQIKILYKKGIQLRKLLNINNENSLISDNGLNLIIHNDILSLNLSNSKITDISIYNIAKKCKKLAHISLKNCDFSNNSILILTKNCTELKSLDLENCNLREEDTGKHLEYILDIKYDSDSKSSDCVKSDILNLKFKIIDFYNKNIKDLNLTKCNFIYHGIEYIKDIEYLNLSNNINITDSSIKYFKNMKNLKELYIEGCNITYNGVRELCECNKTNNLLLLSIDIINNSNVEETIQQIVNTFPNLISLNLGKMLIFDSDINYIAKKCTSLQNLTINSMHNDMYEISDITVINLLEKCKNMTTLIIQNIRLKYYFLEYLSYKYPKCKIVLDDEDYSIIQFSDLFYE
jgi:uncharacterized protein YjbI with pentapeptide repeats